MQPWSVMREDDLVGGRELGERGIEAREERGQHVLLVVYRDHDGENRRGHQAALRSSMRFIASHTRSTSVSRISGKSGSVTVSRAMRSELGNCPSRNPFLRKKV